LVVAKLIRHPLGRRTNRSGKRTWTEGAGFCCIDPSPLASWSDIGLKPHYQAVPPIPLPEPAIAAAARGIQWDPSDLDRSGFIPGEARAFAASRGSSCHSETARRDCSMVARNTEVSQVAAGRLARPTSETADHILMMRSTRGLTAQNAGRRVRDCAPKKAACRGLSGAEFESCYCKIRAHPPRVGTLRNATMLKILSAAAILSTTIATPVFAQAAAQEPGANAFNESLGVYGSGPGPMPWPSARGPYASMVHNASNEAEAACSQRYRSYDPSSGTFRGYDGARHPCQ
jgi:hypothetical protein